MGFLFLGEGPLNKLIKEWQNSAPEVEERQRFDAQEAELARLRDEAGCLRQQKFLTESLESLLSMDQLLFWDFV
jgi:hypothetical protein